MSTMRLRVASIFLGAPALVPLLLLPLLWPVPTEESRFLPEALIFAFAFAFMMVGGMDVKRQYYRYVDGTMGMKSVKVDATGLN